jgi:hypothetical protein
MSAPSEPEKYSIDEMMERLKNRPSEDPNQGGELVTRADGSQAIRVRKRKRRSHQPHKEALKINRRARMLQVSGALILLLLAVFAAGAAIVFANSPPFREGLVKKISASSGAAVDLRQFRMNPTSANAGGMILTWPEGNILQDLTLRSVRAEVFPSSFLGKAMAGEEVFSSEGTLNLRIPQAGKPLRETPPLAMEALPVRFKRYAVSKFHVTLSEAGSPLVRLMNSEGSFYPENPAGRPQLLLSRGDVAINGWPKLRLDRAHIEFRGSDVDVVGLRIRHDNDSRGAFELRGTILPYSPEKVSTLVVQLESYQLAGIAGPDFARFFSGEIDSVSSIVANELTFIPGPKADSALTVGFSKSITSTFEMKGFPFLSGLALILDNKWYLQPTFESDVSGVLRRAKGIVLLGDLRIENKDYMAIKGAVSMAADGKLSGTLEVGITEAMIEAAKVRRLDAMFTPATGGFRWIKLKIGGTSLAPTDNFKELYDSGSAAEAAAPGGKIPSFEELTQPE